MSEQWMGLHHPDWHDSVGVRAWCRCGTWCSDGAACDCCELVELRAEVETLRAQVQAVRDVCEQQVKDRSLYSADRDKHGLDRIDGWNDALDIVEQALDGAK